MLDKKDEKQLESLEIELGMIDEQVSALRMRREIIVQRVVSLRSKPYLPRIKEYIKSQPTRSVTSAGGITRETILDSLRLCPDAELIIFAQTTRLEILKWDNSPLSVDPNAIFVLFGLPCFVRKGLMDYTARLVRTDKGKPVDILEVAFA